MRQLSQIQRSSIKISDQDQDEIQPVQYNKKSKDFSSKHCKIVYSLLIGIVLVFTYLLSNCSSQRQVIPQNQSHLITNLKKFEHDSNCYTQGLSFINDTHILQSCGLYKQSYMQILQYNTTKYPNAITRVLKTDFSQASFFTQGSVFFPKNGLIYMSTWREHKVFRFQYRQGQLKQKDSLNWIYEGWGLTHDNQNLIISDGSSNLFVTDQRLNILKTIHVRDSSGNPITYLNELQYVEWPNGSRYVYANVYLSTKIVKINYSNQKVEQIYDFKDLADQQTGLKFGQVLNGIAFDKKSQTFLLTGKKWHSFYLIKGL